MKLSSGMTRSGHKSDKNPKNDSLSGKDICSIVRACAKSGVKEFRFGELEVIFKQTLDELNSERSINVISRPDEYSGSAEDQLSFPDMNKSTEKQKVQYNDDDYDPYLDVTNPAMAEELAVKEYS